MRREVFFVFLVASFLQFCGAWIARWGTAGTSLVRPHSSATGRCTAPLMTWQMLLTSHVIFWWPCLFVIRMQACSSNFLLVKNRFFSFFFSIVTEVSAGSPEWWWSSSIICRYQWRVTKRDGRSVPVYCAQNRRKGASFFVHLLYQFQFIRRWRKNMVKFTGELYIWTTFVNLFFSCCLGSISAVCKGGKDNCFLFQQTAEVHIQHMPVLGFFFVTFGWQANISMTLDVFCFSYVSEFNDR